MTFSSTQLRQKDYYSGKLRKQIIFQWLCFNGGKGMKEIYQLQDTIPQHCVESTTWQTSWMSFIAGFEKNTIHTSCNPHLPQTCTADKWRSRAEGLQMK